MPSVGWSRSLSLWERVTVLLVKIEVARVVSLLLVLESIWVGR
jgi:hypothetical protein